MISASAPFLTANAVLAKQPVLIAYISGYNRAFSSSVVAGPLYPDLGLGGLCGCFTDGAGAIVGEPFPIGTSYMALRVPVGATQLQLGLNETILFDNTGAYDVDVNGVSVTVPGIDGPWNWVAGGLNTAFQFGSGGGTDPVTVAATGLVAGQIVTIHYTGGLVGHPGIITDADGEVDQAPGGNPVPSDHTYAPSRYMPITIYPWLVSVDDHQTTVNDLDGGVDLADLVFNVQDYQQQITADMAGFVFEGRRCRLLHGFVGMNLTDYVAFFTGAIDTVASANGNAEYQFTVPTYNSAKLSALIYTTGDDGFPIDSTHPRTVNGHPIDILVSALGQAGVPSGSIDTAKVDFYRDTIYSGESFVFKLTSAPVAKDFIENELMKPLGAYLRENNLGVMTVQFFYPALSGNVSYTPPTLPVATEDDTKATEVPLAGEAALVDAVTFKFDDDGTGNGNFFANSLQEFQPSIAKYGLVGSRIIESKGMRSAFQGFFWAQIISRLIFLRYGSKNLILDAIPFFWSECLLEPGDIVALTLPEVPNRAAGTFGITAATFEVLDVKRRFMTGLIELTLLAIDLAAFKQYLITPNAEPSFASDTPTNQATYMYQCDATGKYSTGAAANTLG